MGTSALGGPWQNMEDRRRQLLQTQENSTRLAQAFAHFTTTGWGEWTIPHVVRFDCTFVEKPTVAHGYAIEDEDLVDTRFPRGWGGVYRWQQNYKGFYTGAWVFFIVETQSLTIDTFEDEPGYTLTHFFHFTGMALKDVPAHLLEHS